jgi:flagellar capping protein FliD
MPVSQINSNSLASGQTLSVNGITFPATKVPSANANTLDDYEEGTWTPALNSSGASFTYPRGQYGSYCKIGGFVYAQFYIGADATGTTSNSCNIANLPFAAANLGPLAQASATAWVSNAQNIGFTVDNNTTNVTLWRQNGGIALVTAAQATGGYIVGVIVYRAS